MNVKWMVIFVLLVLLVFGLAACGRPTPAPGVAVDLSAESVRVQYRHPGEVVREMPSASTSQWVLTTRSTPIKPAEPS